MDVKSIMAVIWQLSGQKSDLTHIYRHNSLDIHSWMRAGKRSVGTESAKGRRSSDWKSRNGPKGRDVKLPRTETWRRDVERQMGPRFENSAMGQGDQRGGRPERLLY
jgi:hypothetical protein